MLSQADGAGRRAVRSLRACLQSGGAPILEIMHACMLAMHRYFCFHVQGKTYLHGQTRPGQSLREEPAEVCKCGAHIQRVVLHCFNEADTPVTPYSHAAHRLKTKHSREAADSAGPAVETGQARVLLDTEASTQLRGAGHGRLCL